MVLTGNAGRTYDLTIARANGNVQACLTHRILIRADRAQGAGFHGRGIAHPVVTTVPYAQWLIS